MSASSTHAAAIERLRAALDWHPDGIVYDAGRGGHVMSKPVPESLRCTGTGRDTLPGASYPFTSIMPPRQSFSCPSCHRRVMARIGGVRGHYVYIFEPHLRQGVTKTTLRRAMNALRLDLLCALAVACMGAGAFLLHCARCYRRETR